MAGKMFGESNIWQKKVWRMNRSAKKLLIVITNLDGFSLANCRQFAEFAKLSTHQTFLLYSILVNMKQNLYRIFPEPVPQPLFST